MFPLTASFKLDKAPGKVPEGTGRRTYSAIRALQNICLNSGESHHEKRHPVFLSRVTLILFPDEYSALQVICYVLNIMIF